jgi:hypothetical protein
MGVKIGVNDAACVLRDCWVGYTWYLAAMDVKMGVDATCTSRDCWVRDTQCLEEMGTEIGIDDVTCASRDC